MTDQTPVIGALLRAYVPDADDLIDLGYTGIRFYTATSEAGSYSLVHTSTLVAGTTTYDYNHTTALVTDWFYFVPYGATPGEGVRSESMPVGPPQSTRILIRQGVGNRLDLMAGPYALASVSSSTVAVISELIDPDASPHRIANRFARVVAGTGIGQTRRLRSGSTGYTIATGTITAGRAYSPAWVGADTVELWLSDRDRDMSAVVDLAMDESRVNLWWEDVTYLVSDGSSEYWLPNSIVSKGQVKRVEIAWGQYPATPDWRRAGWWDVVMDGGTPKLSVFATGLGNNPVDSSRIIRVIYNRMGDVMNSDTDYWMVPIEWAIAETELALALMLSQGRGSTESVENWARLHDRALKSAMIYRGLYSPASALNIQGAR